MNQSPWVLVMGKLQALKDRVDALPSIREATVTSSAPLRVRFDTDTAAVDAHASLVAALSSGERVLTLRLARYVWVLGRRGGQVAPFATAAGFYSFTGLGSEPASTTITFPAGRFDTAPRVVVSCDTSAPWNTDASAGSVTAGGFTLFGRRTDGGDTLGVSWVAVQMTPTSASG